MCFLLCVPTGAAVLYLIENRESAQPVWLALAAAPALAAAATTDWLLRRHAGADRTHGGRPGQGRTRTATDRWHR
ncbi:hypothetical protein [Kitasatospora phosalacinea]|uniref:Uncharacterized protein n=1 Tax=Kitasatospora phosalacinea TaxID=2065 RepID=A0A9W6UTF2_9ACTN|nr:hypothetical protein [Kitasatospora phosalacinea]GLW58545.1 hypothetical protein Kpho01_65560 [Kitasatospora phosalacinea]